MFDMCLTDFQPRLGYSLTIIGCVLSLAQLGGAGSAAAGEPKTATRVARTSWGDPDLQGIWNNGTITPLERPEALAERAELTERERTELDRDVATREDRRSENPVTDLEQAYNGVWWDRGKSTGRTSLIVDPPSGRLPPLTADGQQRRDARPEADHLPAQSWQDRLYQERCLLYHGVPPMPTGYNNNYQILQTAEYVAIVYEMLREVRLIPLDGRPHVTGGIRQWMGEARGRWEGETLVVETTNFSDKIDSFRFANTSLVNSFPVLGRTLRVVERFKRVDRDRIDYQFTIHDPATYTTPWTGMLPMTRTQGPMFEYACHEGNYSLEHTLGANRK
jgi:hypothetical protein